MSALTPARFYVARGHPDAVRACPTLYHTNVRPTQYSYYKYAIFVVAVYM